jgi:hypothetical protein
MRVSEAKDFLVHQAAEQAQLGGVSLSDLEKRMMYFTESADASEDPIKLNDEFDSKYDTAGYEAKVSGLLKRARARLKKENPEAVRQWDECVRVLRKGDHYILILLGQDSTIPIERPPHDLLKLSGTAILIVGGLALVIGFFLLSYHYGVPMRGWHTGSNSYSTMPAWIQRLLLAAIVGASLAFVLPTRYLKKPLTGIGQLLLGLFRPERKDKPEG